MEDPEREKEKLMGRHLVRGPGPAKVTAAAVAVMAAFLLLALAASPANAAETADWLPLKGTYGNAIGYTWPPNGGGLRNHTEAQKGIDFIVPTGTKIYAAGPGRVTSYGGCHPTNSPGCNGYAGNYVEIDHPDGRQSRYLHLSSVTKPPGSNASRGDLIGYSGNSGGSPVAHLHYDERVNGSKVAPGGMKAVHGGSLKLYPKVLGYSKWNEVPAWGGHTVRNDSFNYSDSIENGDYISVRGSDTVYKVAGGAPLKVYSWSGVGGSKPFYQVTQSQFDKLRDYPKDGTAIRGVTSGKIYIVAGGAPMYVTSWSAIGGPKEYTNVDQRAIDNQLRDYPKDGTVINGVTSGKVYVVAGGAPMYVTSWSSIGGPKDYTNVAQGAIDNQLRSYPRDGTFVRGYDSERIYEVAEQRVVYISNPSEVDGPPVTIGDSAIINQLSGGCTIIGSRGDDNLKGTSGKDVICGRGGDDTLYGFGGDDVLRGGDGNDRLVGGPGNDRLHGQDGRDFLFGISGEDYANGGRGNDVIRGNQGNDRLIGAIGNDTVIGGKDDDTMFGGPGTDRLIGQGGQDRLFGISGDDYANGGSGDDTIRGDRGHDRLVGFTGNDRVIGSEHNDTMFGGPGRDRLFGQQGRDRLVLRDGVRGNDSANGGGGRDRAVRDPRDRLVNIP